MGNSSAERAAQSRSPGAGVARQGAARARWRAIMLAGDRAATEYRGRAEARLGRWREPLHASRGRGGRWRGGRGRGGGRAQRRGAPALALGGGRCSGPQSLSSVRRVSLVGLNESLSESSLEFPLCGVVRCPSCGVVPLEDSHKKKLRYLKWVLWCFVILDFACLSQR